MLTQHALLVGTRRVSVPLGFVVEGLKLSGKRPTKHPHPIFKSTTGHEEEDRKTLKVDNKVPVRGYSSA
jgi:hypothetical protein